VYTAIKISGGQRRHVGKGFPRGETVLYLDGEESKNRRIARRAAVPQDRAVSRSQKDSSIIKYGEVIAAASATSRRASTYTATT
jgi:hypothetical protein